MATTRVDKTKAQLEVTADTAAAALLGTPAGASMSVDIAAVKTEVNKIGAVGDAVAAAGAAGSVHAHVRDVQTQIGVGTDVSTADGVVGSLHAKFRLIYAAIITTIGGLIGASDAAIGTLAGAGESVFARIRYWGDAIYSLVGTVATNLSTLIGVNDKAMLQHLARRFGNATATKTNSTSFLTPSWNGQAASVTETAYLVEQSFTANKLYVQMSGVVDQNVIVTLRKNYADTAVTCTLTASTDTVKSDLAHSVAFAVGDQMSIKVGLAIAPSTDPTGVGVLVLGTV